MTQQFQWFVCFNRMFCFFLQTSECFRWVLLTHNNSVIATVSWNVVTSVKNISSCGPQKSTVIVSFLRSTVRCLYYAHITTKKWSLPSVMRRSRRKQFLEKIILSYPMQKPSLNVSHKELFTSCVAFARHTCFLYCEIVLADRLHCKKFLWFVFASTSQSDHYGKSCTGLQPQSVIASIRTT